MAPAESLSRKIRWIFILQGVLASVVVTLGTLYGSLQLREMLLKQRIVSEAQHVWELVESDPSAPLPQSNSFESYFVPTGGMPDRVPPRLRALKPGLHSMDDGIWRLAYISQRAEGRVYLNVAPGLSDHLVLWISVLAVVLAVVGIALISWLGYRRCKRIVAPVSQLTDSVVKWDPRHAKPSHFELPAVRGETTYEVGHLRDALASMSRRMQDFVDRERNFTRDASHELRTPVTVVRVATDLLGNEPLSERGQRSLRRIGQATHDMETLIDAFLVLARHPDVPVDTDRIRVADVAHEEAAMARPLLEGRAVTLEVLESADPYVHAPPKVLGVILSQLLRNACHYTDTGRVQVDVLEDRITISDTGIGMDADTLSHAFDPFWRADISDYTSKGMGLTIAQRLAERMGWDIRLESEPGRGTVATLTFA